MQKYDQEGNAVIVVSPLNSHIRSILRYETTFYIPTKLNLCNIKTYFLNILQGQIQKKLQ